MRIVRSASMLTTRPGFAISAQEMDTIGPALTRGLSHSERVVAWQKRQDASWLGSCLWIGAQNVARRSRLKHTKAHTDKAPWR